MNTLQSIVHPAGDLDAAKAIHSALLGTEARTGQPGCVGFNVGPREGSPRMVMRGPERGPALSGGLAVATVTSSSMPRSDQGRSQHIEPSSSPKGEDPSQLDDWRVATLSRIRSLIKQADPEVAEERKWKKPTNPEGVPVWAHDGMICTGETYKKHVKITFAKGASLTDPSHLFNSSLEGSARRAIDIHDGEEIDEEAFKALIRAAVALNGASSRRK